MKRLTPIILVAVFLVSLLSGCGGGNATLPQGTPNQTTTPTQDTFTPTGGTLRVLNAADYMDMSTVRDFEREFNIKVVYDEFESNEALYQTIKKDSSAYDVLIPSDYMIDRLKQEGLIQKFDKDNIPNIENVASQYLKPSYDINNDYVVPYMTGTVGILYNTRVVTGEVDSWNLLWNSQLQRTVYMWDSMRDVLAAALIRAGYSLNSIDSAQINEAASALQAQRSFVRYDSEIILSYMVADEGAAALVYSGEAKLAVDQNPRLAYVIPKEGSNKWVDGFVISSGAQNKKAAEDFINFMCRPNIAVRNMSTIGYTSPITGAWSEFANNPIMFPSEEELARCEAFTYDATAFALYEQTWGKVRK